MKLMNLFKIPFPGDVRLRNLYFCIFILMACLLGCGQEKIQRGIEAGNPNLSPVNRQVTLRPSVGDEFYQATFLDQDKVKVGRLQSLGDLTQSVMSRSLFKHLDALLETVTISYTQVNRILTFEAIFSDGMTIRVSLTLDEGGHIVSGHLEVNGRAVSVTVEESLVAEGGSSSPSLEEGLAHLRSRNVPSAESSFCNGLTANPDNPQLAFGCFWSRLMLLPERDESAALLTAFDESPFDLETQLLGEMGLFANLDRLRIGEGNHFPYFNYLSFDLPFSNFVSGISGLSSEEKIARLLDLVISNGLTVEDLHARLDALIPYFIEFQSMLGVVLSDTDFTFSLPGELYYQGEDLEVIYNDVVMMLAGIQASWVALDWSGAYDYGISIEDIVQGGTIDQEILVSDLNGTGETINGVAVDDTMFLTLVDGSRIAQTRDRFLASLLLQKAAFQALHRGEPSDIFTAAVDEFDLSSYIAFLDDAIRSMDGMIDPSSSLLSGLRINLGHFFTDPPDAAMLDIGSGDPFVLEDGQATPVEEYFRDLLEGVVEF